MRFDEAPIGKRRTDGKFTSDQSRCDDLGKLPRFSVPVAVKQGEAFALRRQLGPTPDRADDEVREPRVDVEVVFADELDVDETDAGVDDLRHVLSAGDEDRRQPVCEMRVHAERNCLHRAEPSGADKGDQLAT